MRVLFDIVHPAHVHFYRHMMDELRASGAEIQVASRFKDVTADLLDSFGIDHRPVSATRSGGRSAQARELAVRVAALARMARRSRPDLIVTRNPAGVLAARLTPGTRSVFDTDDGAAAGLHYRLGALADVVTMPDCLTPTAPARTRLYPSYKVLAYLHPSRYEPRDARAELGLGDDHVSVIRLVSMQAAHDHGEQGMPDSARAALIDLLADRGHLFISSEAPLPADLERHAMPLGPDRLHDLLVAADLYLGDSQTVAAEAAVLGTPTVHVSSWSRRLDYLIELEDRFRLIESYKPEQGDAVIDAVERLSADPAATRATWRRRTEDMLAARSDLTSWYVDLLRELAG